MNRLGRRYSPNDQDKGFLMRRKLLPAGVTLPTSKTWAIKAAALDQGDTGTCVGHAWANFLRAAPIQTNKDIDQLRWDIYDKAILLDEWTDNDQDTDRQMGTSVRAGAEAVMGMHRLKSYLWAFNLQPTVEWVLTQGPVVLGINWYHSFFNPSPEGIISIKTRDYVAGGHAILMRGVNTKRALARLSNSWGDNWGLSGECLIPFRDLEILIHEDGEAATAVENKLRSILPTTEGAEGIQESK